MNIDPEIVYVDHIDWDAVEEAFEADDALILEDDGDA